jgi:hypothetical protein
MAAILLFYNTQTTCAPSPMLLVAARAEIMTRNVGNIMMKQKWTIGLILAVVALPIAGLLYMPMEAIVDYLFGITWSMRPPAIAWVTSLATFIIVVFLAKRSLGNKAVFVLYPLFVVLLSFTMAVAWAWFISSCPGY